MSDSFQVGEDAAGQRLDKFLSSQPSVGSRRRARDAIESGKVLVNGKRVGAAERALSVARDMTVEIEWNRPGTAPLATRSRGAMERAGLRIVHEDADLLVVDKPPGLLTDAATYRQEAEEDTVKSLTDEWLRTQGDAAFIVHRIDRDTSGLVVLARNPVAEGKLREQFMSHSPQRTYWALVSGGPRDEQGQWSDPMRWDPDHNLQCLGAADDPSSVIARASFRVLERIGEAASVLEVQLDTGRRNQIRLHCQLAGYPIVGERQYIPARVRKPTLPAPRQALHARRLGIIHPTTGQPIRFTSPLPPDLAKVAQRLRKNIPAKRT